MNDSGDGQRTVAALREGATVGQTELEAGSYVFMDTAYFAIRSDAARIIADVNATPTGSRSRIVMKMAKAVEPYRLFFLKTPWLPRCGVVPDHPPGVEHPFAMGELFVNRHEWLSLVTNRWIDFIRIHISDLSQETLGRCGIIHRCKWGLSHGPLLIPQCER